MSSFFTLVKTGSKKLENFFCWKLPQKYPRFCRQKAPTNIKIIKKRNAEALFDNQSVHKTLITQQFEKSSVKSKNSASSFYVLFNKSMTVILKARNLEGKWWWQEAGDSVSLAISQQSRLLLPSIFSKIRSVLIFLIKLDRKILKKSNNLSSASSLKWISSRNTPFLPVNQNCSTE